MDEQVPPVASMLAQVPDPRAARGRRHPWPAVLLMIVAGLVSGANSQRGLARWGHAVGLAGRRRLGFTQRRGPSLATLHRVRCQLDFDFFFVHFKGTDTAGENGDFAAKVAAIEEVDRALPALLELRPDVLLVAGDHSTPAVIRSHSWHPVPFLLHGPWVRPDPTATFDERSCLRGALGTFPATSVLPLALAHGGRLARYGA